MVLILEEIIMFGREVGVWTVNLVSSVCLGWRASGRHDCALSPSAKEYQPFVLRVVAKMTVDG